MRILEGKTFYLQHQQVFSDGSREILSRGVCVCVWGGGVTKKPVNRTNLQILKDGLWLLGLFLLVWTGFNRLGLFWSFVFCFVFNYMWLGFVLFCCCWVVVFFGGVVCCGFFVWIFFGERLFIQKFPLSLWIRL